MSGVSPASLEWGIRRTFIEYVSGLDDGEITAEEPATVSGLGRFSFPAQPGSELDPKTGFGVLKFSGTAHASGHFGLMSVTITDPWIEIGLDCAALTIPDPDRDPVSGKRIALATLTLKTEDGSNVWVDIASTLAVEAIGIFNRQYESGSAMDPVTVVYPQR
ncbi:HtaA domain-containing protein [Arthrobacter sp. MMS18-M83]|uniref:HtaA domain-containing protein n=1 Tax=Arthrobacter sp. MMS18-M83 TaxID=2996261 RepID=UPI00227A7EED|nr:HtaA domain-containing protein [Arthrobacter sp. MMS18-M83]WAH97745.1 HtaA domain-containing protein [Arthrobacter sp. MMS18-M83]